MALCVLIFGVIYIVWRWTDSIAWNAWWIALPLVIAETYSFGESALFALVAWRARRRPAPRAASADATVDVFITTYNEPLEMVLRTARAALGLDHRHNTWILDDGARDELATAARHLGVGYLTRSDDWEGFDRYAKAGNINNALFQTEGEFVAIFDADQVPEPQFLTEVLGYFHDEDVAFVQTPQHFWNVPDDDPLGCQAELFYGPIQQGKDGWGAAFFCGSNAVLRREALMQLGVGRYSAEVGPLTLARLAESQRRLRTEIKSAPAGLRRPLELAVRALADARDRIRDGDRLGEVSFDLRMDFRRIADKYRLWPPTQDLLNEIATSVEVTRVDQALAVHPVDVATVTEDMATAMRLHAMGWSSVYHDEVLVHGLAPDDLRTMLGQRQRWAAGSMQVFFGNNPMVRRGLTLAQRLMYMATMTSYLTGFTTLVYIVAPIVFLTVGVFPMNTAPGEFFIRFIPFFAACQALYLIAGHGRRGLWRGQQYSFALFPTWIVATLSAAAAVFLRRDLHFSVTAKEHASNDKPSYRAVWMQLTTMAVLVVAIGIGLWRAVLFDTHLFPTVLTLIWVTLDLLLLGVVIRAARYRGRRGTVADAAARSAVAPPGIEPGHNWQVRALSTPANNYPEESAS